ncbi:MAG TPA: beta-galactosidase, partial [Asticcacaulis sp.]
MDRRAVLKTLGAMAAAAATPFAANAQNAARPGRFTAADDGFLLDGQPFQVLAGEMHYPRIPRDSWRDRLRKLKALGLNTLTTYVFWNAHEPKPGVYDFSGNLDVAAYVKLAQEEGLYVNLRPGPFVCAEWDGGGLPAWLFPTDDI